MMDEWGSCPRSRHCAPLRPQACTERNRQRRLLARVVPQQAISSGPVGVKRRFPRQSEDCLGMTEKVSLRTSAHAGVAISSGPVGVKRRFPRQCAHCLGMTEKVSLRTSAHAGVAISSGPVGVKRRFPRQSEDCLGMTFCGGSGPVRAILSSRCCSAPGCCRETEHRHFQNR